MKKIILFSLLAICGVLIIACTKNKMDSPPVITSVKTVDSTHRDSTFISALPGALVVIEGNNFNGLQAVFFNDTSAYFNPAYTTDQRIILTIPSTAQTRATNPNVPNVIRVVTDHGSATYNFTLYLPPPFITSIAFDNSGTLVYINGGNFQGVNKIRFPVPGTADTALSYTVNKTYTQITAVIPPGSAFVDSLRVYCTFGTASFSYPPPMTITSVSNENGAANTTITVNGTNFIGITKVIFPGNKLGTNIQVLSVNQLSVKVPTGITAVDSLRIEGGLGKAVSSQLYGTYITHPTPGYLCTFDAQYSSDNTGFVGWTGGYADAPATATTYPGGTGGSGVLIQSSPMPANAGPTTQGNSGILQLSPFPWVANTATSINNYSLKFELYVASPWSKGSIWIAVGDWYTWTSYTARFAPWATAPGGVYNVAGWHTITIPLTQFLSGNQFYQTTYNAAGAKANTFADYPTTGMAFMIANDQAIAVPANSVNIAVDNVRIVRGQ